MAHGEACEPSLESTPVGKQVCDRELKRQGVIQESCPTFLTVPAERIGQLLHVSQGNDCRQPRVVVLLFPSRGRDKPFRGHGLRRGERLSQTCSQRSSVRFVSEISIPWRVGAVPRRRCAPPLGPPGKGSPQAEYGFSFGQRYISDPGQNTPMVLGCRARPRVYRRCQTTVAAIRGMSFMLPQQRCSAAWRLREQCERPGEADAHDKFNGSAVSRRNLVSEGGIV
jgi:hypothetical protein